VANRPRGERLDEVKTDQMPSGRKRGASFTLGALAVGLGVVAAILSSPALGVITALVAALAWYFDHRAAVQKEAALEQRAAKAEHALAQLQERTKGRQLADDERVALTESLRTCPGEIVVRCIGGNSEPCAFAEELAAVLTAAGWTISTFDRGILYPAGPPAGVLIEVKSRENAPPRAATLLRSLRLAHITAIGVIGATGGDVELIVGTKP
jgi:hypothetical protein